jgi:small-conductance mechanosensitive channel
MFKHKFKVGDRVQIREWDEMAKKFGMHGTSINVKYFFTEGMRKLCGHSATISDIVNDSIYLKDWDDNRLYLGMYHISTDMIEPFEGTIKVKFSQKEFSKLMF